MLERITASFPAGPARFGHEFRYQLAAGFTEPGSAVLDAACGSGYGYAILARHSFTDYMGVDVAEPTDLPVGAKWSRRDLSLPSHLGYEFDTFVGFETIEHLSDYSHYIALAHQARRWIVVSAPVVPTKHANPWHLHDFERGDLVRLFATEGWEHFQTVDQPAEVSEVSVFRRAV